MVTDIAPALADTAAPAEPDASTAPVAPSWAAPALLIAVLMLGADFLALIPLGHWMAEFGIVPVCTVYLVHVLGSTALAVWTVIRMPVLDLDC
ncbi:hypothetical protein [Nocardia sp. SSK8]|uniref:hypothetical protein n=1 Tax=Nocardia sp. SSK8 TaxID=3120154 RepID=UPI003008E946